MKFLITGGAGFIGSAVVRYIINETQHCVINVDKLTYAGNLDSLISVCSSERYTFFHADICDRSTMINIFETHRPDVLLHLAAESHVDRSIDGPSDFINTNIVGTFSLLEAAKQYWQSLSKEGKRLFRFHHISTDEVYGDLENLEGLFREDTRYAPSSPYSASKAASDHLVRAWGRTYGLPIIISTCSNNYGPYHFPEKLIPLTILNAIRGHKLPVYGKGNQIRDWLYVEDHARAIFKIATDGTIGETYNIGGHNEKQNIEVVKAICSLLDEIHPSVHTGIQTYADLITFVKDRPGHDKRYAIDASKLEYELGWTPLETFQSGLRKTVEWYLANEEWWTAILDGSYRTQ